MSNLTIKRLDNRQGTSWAMYFVFEARCLKFIDQHQIDFDPGLFRGQLRQRFTDDLFDRHQLVVFLDQTGSIKGHFLAWLEASFGRPYIHVNQLEVDEGASLLDIREPMFTLVDEWVARLNAGVPPNAPHVDTVQFWTWHDPEVFARYLRVGCDLKISRHVLEYKVSERKNPRLVVVH